MLNATSMSGRYCTKFSIMPTVACCCHSAPFSIFTASPALIKRPIKALSKPRASLVLALITDGSSAQKGNRESKMVSYSSMSCTPLAFANSYHISKLGGGGMLYRRLYSATASVKDLDCRACSSVNCASASATSRAIGCRYNSVAGRALEGSMFVSR